MKKQPFGYDPYDSLSGHADDLVEWESQPEQECDGTTVVELLMPERESATA